MKELNKKIFVFYLLFFGFSVVNFGDSHSKEFEESFIMDDSNDNGFASKKAKSSSVYQEEEKQNDSDITGIRIDKKDFDSTKEGETEKVELPKIRLSEVDKKDFADIVVLQGLDKVTAKISIFEVEVGESAEFKRLEIYPKRCWKAPPEENPENKVLLEIYENRLDGKREEIFYGWMFSSSPGLSTLEHPVYDITVIDCRFKDSDDEDREDNKNQEDEEENEESSDE